MIEDSSDLATEKTSEIANRQSYVANLFDPASFHHVSLCDVAACQTRAGTKRFTIDDLRCMICDFGEFGYGACKGILGSVSPRQARDRQGYSVSNSVISEQ